MWCVDMGRVLRLQHIAGVHGQCVDLPLVVLIRTESQCMHMHAVHGGINTLLYMYLCMLCGRGGT